MNAQIGLLIGTVMTKRTKGLLLVGVIFISSMAGCLSEVSSQVESENTDLKIENAELNSTITNLTLENQSLTSLHLQLNDEIANLTEMKLELEALLLEKDGGLSGNSTTHLLFENYNASDAYMNHANWNGGLWDRVIFDEQGIPKVQFYFGLHYAPSTAFHWGLVSYSKWINTNNISNFIHAKEIADWAVMNQSEQGGWGWYFDHNFSRGVLGELQSGWYSAMTQGLGMSLLSRMYSVTGNTDYKNASINATKLFDVLVEDGGVLAMYNSMPWYEEYPTPDGGSFVLNGFIYSLIGLYDSWKLLNHTDSKDKYLDGINSLGKMISLFDLGCYSSYDLVHHSIESKAPNIARESYHGLHISQLSLVNVFESNRFLEIQNRWIEYANGICAPHN